MKLVGRPKGVFGYARRLWKQATCNHSHCAKFELEGATRVYGAPFGSRSCKTCGIQLCCCYKCGHVWAYDWKA